MAVHIAVMSETHNVDYSSLKKVYKVMRLPDVPWNSIDTILKVSLKGKIG